MSGNRGGDARRSPRQTARRLLAAVATAAALLGGLVAPLVVAEPAHAAIGCDYADTTANNGAHAATVCWFDFANFNESLARTFAGQPMSIELDGGYVATFSVKVTNVAGTSPLTIAARTTPLETRFAFGTDAYRGVDNVAALYSQPGAGTKGANLTFDTIAVVDSSGVPVTGFSFIAADVEDNVSGESFVWRSDKPIKEIERLAPNGNWGCKNPVGDGTTELSCAGTGAGGTTIAGGKSSALIVAADTPTTFSTQWITHAQSGIAIGIQTAKITVNKAVVDRVNSTDSFDVRVISPENTVLGSASTGAAATATTGAITVLPRTDGAVFTLDEIATPASGTNLDRYQRDWSCTNTTAGSTTALPSGSAVSVGVAPKVGDNIVCTVTNTGLPHALTVNKTSSATADTRVGDPVLYEVTVTNTGTIDFTASQPARATDDFSAVLDDAVYNGDAAATTGTIGVVGGVLSWEGALPAGESAIITYSMTLESGGDGVVTNTACALNPGEDPTCETIEFLLPRLTIDKSVSTLVLPAVGDPLTYTVVVTNVGPGDYTASSPATASDDLTDVLDDATWDPASLSATSGTATYTSPTVSWSGVLTAGQSATITYSVDYTGDGDQLLVNNACMPATQVAPGAEACDTVTVEGSALSQSKTVNPTSGASVAAGQEVTYTLRFENDGPADGAVDTFDDVTDVLDDATLTAGPTSSNPALTATLNGNSIEVLGTVPAGTVVTVTYTVTVNAFAEQGDHVLGNVLMCPAADPDCVESVTENPIRHLTVTKSSVPVSGVEPGDTVTYTVAVTNDGEGDYTVETPAQVADDLTEVLDDAVYNDDAVATLGIVSYIEPTLSWSHPLIAGGSASFSYTVLVTNSGDHELRNTAGAVCASTEICDPVVSVEHLLPHVVPSKSSDPAPGTALSAGDVVAYMLSWTNDGAATGAVDSTDDLTGVLDDAIITMGPTSSDPAVTAIVDAASIRVSGPIGIGGTVTVIYEVTIRPDGEHGDNLVGNVLTQDAPPELVCDAEGNCLPPTSPATEHPVGELDDWKTVDPGSGAAVRSGDRMTYTLHFQNVGLADVVVNRDDVLTGVLDDATLSGAAVSSDPALTASALTGERFTVTGTLVPSQLVTVTYTVTVKPDGERGDDQLANFLVPTGAAAPLGCDPAGLTQSDCTRNAVSELAFTGGTLARSAVIAGLVLLLAGGGALVIGRRVRRVPVGDAGNDVIA